MGYFPGHDIFSQLHLLVGKSLCKNFFLSIKTQVLDGRKHLLEFSTVFALQNNFFWKFPNSPFPQKNNSSSLRLRCNRTCYGIFDTVRRSLPAVYNITPYSYSRFCPEISLHLRLMQGVFSNANGINLSLMIFPHMSLQHQEYENGLFSSCKVTFTILNVIIIRFAAW